MIRVAPDRCGYDGYVCVGYPELDGPYKCSRVLCDSEVMRVQHSQLVPSEIEGTGIFYSNIDNYLNLPTRFKGFVMTLEKLLDMSDGVAPPEITCRTNTNPLDGGFLDLFHHDSYNSVVYGALSDDPADPDSAWIMLNASLMCFNSIDVLGEDDPSDGDEKEFNPGLLEPMLDTSFKPVSIEALTGIDAVLDGIVLALALLTRWRIEVDKKLNKLIAAITHIYGIRNMLIAMQKASICSNFKITLVSGSPIQWRGIKTSPKYDVAGGTVSINSVAAGVGGLTNLSAPFYTYLNFYPENCNGSTGQYGNIRVELATSKAGSFSLGVGGVRRVDAEKKVGIPRYTIFEIVQERCVASVEMVRTCKEGVLFRLASGISPYQALDVADCEEAEL